MENEPFFVPIERLTPSQLYISASKLEAVHTWFRADRLAESLARTEPIPLKRMAGRLLILDGHTRAAAAYLAGAKSLPCEWEKEEWDWAAYAADIDLCAAEGITSVAALARRIVSAQDCRVLWDERCDRLYEEYPYKVLTEGDEVIFFTRDPVPCPPCDVRTASWLRSAASSGIPTHSGNARRSAPIRHTGGGGTASRSPRGSRTKSSGPERPPPAALCRKTPE